MADRSSRHADDYDRDRGRSSSRRHRDDGRDHSRSRHSRDRSSHRRESSRSHDDRRDESRRSSSRRHSRRSDRESRRRSPSPPPAPPAQDESSGRLAEYLGYSDDVNPFGDPQLTKRFVWRKREATRPLQQTGPDAAAEREAAIVRELAAVEERRRQREAEQLESERLRAEEDRMREEEMHGSYEAQEAAFERVQHRRRTVIRVKEGRERPSDVLVKNLMLVEAGRQRCSALPAAHRSESAALVADPAVDFEVAEPYAVVSALPAVELRALLRDIATLAEMGAEADGTSADELRKQAAEEAALLAEKRGDGPGEAAESVRQARVRAEADLEAKRVRYGRYWACLAVLTEDSLQQAEAEEAGEETGIGGLPTSVERDVIQTMALRDTKGLAELERDVIHRAEAAAAADAALGSARGGSGVGGGAGEAAAASSSGAAPATGGLSVAAYWKAVLRAVAVLRARQELRSIHRELLKQRQRHLARVLKDTMRDAGVAQALWDQADEVDETAPDTGEQTLPPASFGSLADAGAAPAPAAPAPAAAATSAAPSRSAASRAVSPTPLRGSSAKEAAAEAATSEVEIVSPGDLKRLVELERSRAAARLRGRVDGSGGAEAAAAVAAADAATSSSATSSSADRAPSAQMTVQEAIERGLLRSNEFSQEAAETFVGPADGGVAGAVDRSLLTPEEQAAFADRFRPRRPRYITRVRSGYHWNSHNKAYYDRENPPPKMVQGYKFDVFYPDLLDPSKPPTFSLEPADSPAFCMLRIHGGPPYEDVAFKIVNREWLTGKRSGYVCAFDRGVYKLFFNLKTHFYRR